MLSWGGCQQGITVSSLLPSKEEWGTGEGKDLSRATSFSHLVPGCQRRPGEMAQEHWSVGGGGWHH